MKILNYAYKIIYDLCIWIHLYKNFKVIKIDFQYDKGAFKYHVNVLALTYNAENLNIIQRLS